MDIGHVKLWFTTILCWLLFRTKFNCNFVQSYVPVFYMGFLCKGCVWERVWRLKAKWRAKKFSRVDREKPSHEVKHVLSTWLECEESWHMVTISLREYLTGKAFSRDTRETFCFANLSYLIDQVLTHYIYQHIKKSAFQRENSSHYPWEWEIVIPTILYTIHCGFSQLLPLNFQILERLIAQTFTTTILSVKWGFGAAGKYWKKPSIGRCNRSYCGIRKVRQDTVLRNLVGVGAWRT